MTTDAIDATPFEPSGVITLITDFGHKDPFVGVMKGQVLKRFRSATLVDLTHEVRPHAPVEAGFWLGRSYPYFPLGTIHIAVVDPGVGSSRRIALVEAAGHVFMAPDNGLLDGVLQRRDGPVVRRVLAEDRLGELGLAAPSATFHGRDIFAPLAAEMAAGRLAPSTLGPRVDALVPGPWPGPVRAGSEVRGSVVTVDHFGNLLTDVDAGLITDMPAPVVDVAGRQLPVLRTYADVRAGEYLALVNSFGVLEVARAEGSAAAALAAAPGAPVTVRNRERAAGA